MKWCVTFVRCVKPKCCSSSPLMEKKKISSEAAVTHMRDISRASSSLSCKETEKNSLWSAKKNSLTPMKTLFPVGFRKKCIPCLKLCCSFSLSLPFRVVHRFLLGDIDEMVFTERNAEDKSLVQPSYFPLPRDNG